MTDKELIEAAATKFAETAYETRTSAFEGISYVEGIRFQITLKKLKNPVDYDEEEDK